MFDNLLWKVLDSNLRPLRNNHYLVLPDLNIAYARVPKVANSSIKRVLDQTLGRHPGMTHKVSTDHYWKTRVGADLVNIDSLIQKYPQVFVFSFVRNPFDRLVSCYTNKIIRRRKLSVLWRLNGFFHGMSYSEFIKTVAKIDDRRADNHFRSQWSILSHNGELVPEFIGRFEAIDEDWKRLRSRVKELCGQDIGNLLHFNISKKKRSPTSEYYKDKSIIHLVRERYRDDFMQFYSSAPDP